MTDENWAGLGPPGRNCAHFDSMKAITDAMAVYEATIEAWDVNNGLDVCDPCVCNVLWKSILLAAGPMFEELETDDVTVATIGVVLAFSIGFDTGRRYQSKVCCGRTQEDAP